MPVIQENGKLYNHQNEFNVFYHNNVHLYEFTDHFDSSQNGKHILSEKRKLYFIHHADSLFGIMFRLYDTSYTRHRVDTILNELALQAGPWEEIAKLTRLSTSIDQKTGDLVEVYINDQVKEKDSAVFYYNKKFKSVKFSFSRNLDSAKGLKLYKIRMIGDETYLPNGQYLPKRESKIELNEMKLDNMLLRKYFDWYLERKYLHS